MPCRRLPLLVTLCLALGAAGPLHAEAPRKAAGWYRLGTQHFEAGRYAKAALAFDEALARSDDVVLLWNAALAHDSADHLEEAVERYRRLLTRERVPERQRSWALERVSAIERKLTVDAHREAMAAERERLRVELRELLGDELRELLREELDQKEPAAPEWMAPTNDTLGATHEDDDDDGFAVGGWVTLGSGLVATVAGAVLVGHAAGIDDDLRNAGRDGNGDIVEFSQTEADSLKSQADTEAGIGVAALAIGGTAVLVGAVLLVLDATEEDTPVVGLQLDGRHLLFTAAGRF